MRKIYAITAVSSVVQALTCGFLLSSAGPFLSVSVPQAFGVGTALAGISVWAGFFFVRRAMRTMVQPTLGLAVGVGVIAGLVCALFFCGLCRLNPLAQVSGFVILCAVGAVFGVLLGLINFLIWQRIGFIRFIHEPDDAIYQRAFRHSEALTAGQEGVWPPPPLRWED